MVKMHWSEERIRIKREIDQDMGNIGIWSNAMKLGETQRWSKVSNRSQGALQEAWWLKVPRSSG